jgi:hypothetical protein
MILNWYYLIFLIAKASETLIYLLDMSVDTLGGVGLWLHVSKTVILTTETQTPPFLTNRWTSQNERGPKLRVTKPVMRKNYRFRFIHKVLQPIRGLWSLILGPGWFISTPDCVIYVFQHLFFSILSIKVGGLIFILMKFTTKEKSCWVRVPWMLQYYNFFLSAIWLSCQEGDWQFASPSIYPSTVLVEVPFRTNDHQFDRSSNMFFGWILR